MYISVGKLLLSCETNLPEGVDFMKKIFVSLTRKQNKCMEIISVSQR